MTLDGLIPREETHTEAEVEINRVVSLVAEINHMVETASLVEIASMAETANMEETVTPAEKFIKTVATSTGIVTLVTIAVIDNFN